MMTSPKTLEKLRRLETTYGALIFEGAGELYLECHCGSIRPLPVTDGALDLALRAFEIKTLRLTTLEN